MQIRFDTSTDKAFAAGFPGSTIYIVVPLSGNTGHAFLLSEYISFLLRKSKQEAANKRGIHTLIC